MTGKRLSEADLSAFKAREKSRGKPFKLKLAEPLEADIQAQILRALRVHPAVAWAGRFNSGAQVIGEGKSRRYVRFSTVKGLSDILGQLKDGRMLAIEVKRKSGRLSDDQADFVAKVSANNGLAIVARSVSDVWAALGTP